MCRFLAYLGAPIVMDELLFQPKNSLVRQSFKAREREEPLNGDGFGIGWYVPHYGKEPAAFHSTRPAWNNRNLRFNAPKLRSGCMLAHVRAASVGGVSEVNCHPFHHDGILMMHNGQIAQFSKVKRALRNELTDEIYNWIEGTTDSEHLFALFLDHLYRLSDGDHEYEHITAALELAIADVHRLTQDNGITENSHLNLAVSNGSCLVGVRYCTDPGQTPLTLYHSEGSRFQCIDGVCRMTRDDPSHHAILVVSEKLTDYSADWIEVPHNHFVVVREDLRVQVLPVRV